MHKKEIVKVLKYSRKRKKYVFFFPAAAQFSGYNIIRTFVMLCEYNLK